VSGKNDEQKPSGSDIGGLLADLLEGARWRNLSATALPPERTWTKFLAWAAAASLDPRALSFPTAPEAYRFLGEGKNAATLKQCRAALSFAYRHWNLINPFAKIDPPIQKGAPHPLPSSGRHPTASRLSQRPPARLWFGPRIPFGQRALPDGVPV
jgi:hypothetical protein